MATACLMQEYGNNKNVGNGHILLAIGIHFRHTRNIKYTVNIMHCVQKHLLKQCNVKLLLYTEKTIYPVIV